MGIYNPMQLATEAGLQNIQLQPTDDKQIGKPPLPHQKTQSIGTDPVVNISMTTQATNMKANNTVQR